MDITNKNLQLDPLLLCSSPSPDEDTADRMRKTHLEHLWVQTELIALFLCLGVSPGGAQALFLALYPGMVSLGRSYGACQESNLVSHIQGLAHSISLCPSTLCFLCLQDLWGEKGCSPALYSPVSPVNSDWAVSGTPQRASCPCCILIYINCSLCSYLSWLSTIKIPCLHKIPQSHTNLIVNNLSLYICSKGFHMFCTPGVLSKIAGSSSQNAIILNVNRQWIDSWETIYLEAEEGLVSTCRVSSVHISMFMIHNHNHWKEILIKTLLKLLRQSKYRQIPSCWER